MSDKEINKEVIVNETDDETDNVEVEDETQRKAKEKRKYETDATAKEI